MNIAKCAQATAIMNNVRKGHYIRGTKFSNYGSVAEDSLFAQQAEADRKLAQLKMARNKLTKKFA
jgi:hypothetical protein